MPKLRSDDDSKRRNWEAMMALNAETEKRWWLWTPKLRSNDMMTSNADWKKMLDLSAETENAALNAKMKMRLWTPNGKRDLMASNVKLKMQEDNEGKICPNVACYYNSQSMGRVWKRLHESQKMLRWRVGIVKSTINMASLPIWLNREPDKVPE